MPCLPNGQDLRTGDLILSFRWDDPVLGGRVPLAAGEGSGGPPRARLAQCHAAAGQFQECDPRQYLPTDRVPLAWRGSMARANPWVAAGLGAACSKTELPTLVEVVDRAFRFGLQVMSAPSRESWRNQARRAEDLGFDTILVPDHVVDGLFSPMVALCGMADVTSSIRVGTFVLNNDFRHPALLAREAATADLLAGGRLELGLGAGHAAPEYAEIGLDFDRGAVRVERLEESVGILRRLFDGEAVTVEGKHYQLQEHRLYPPVRPTLLVGGNGNRVLRLGAKQADIVGLTGLGRTRPDGQRHEMEWEAKQIDAKVSVVRQAAGSRLDELELNALVQYIEVTDNRRAAVEPVAAYAGGDPDVMLTAPYLLLGTVDEIVEQLCRARDRWGFTYFVTRSAERTGHVIAAIHSER